MFLFTNHVQNHSNMVKRTLGQAEIPAAESSRWIIRNLWTRLYEGQYCDSLCRIKTEKFFSKTPFAPLELNNRDPTIYRMNVFFTHHRPKKTVNNRFRPPTLIFSVCPFRMTTEVKLTTVKIYHKIQIF